MIIELPDYLPKSLQDHLENYLISNDFQWHFLKDVTTEQNNNVPGFHHTPFKDGIPNSIHYDSILFLSHYIRKTLNLENLVLHRVRYGMNIRSSTNLKYNTPHLDFPDDFPHKHYTALYYVNNSDGDTFIFNEKKRSKTYSILKQISPEKGKLCVFDGEHFHASSCPKKSNYRIVITLNLYDPA